MIKCDKRKAIMIYIIYVIMCLLFFGTKAFEDTKNRISVQYGVSTDDIIEITEDREVSCEIILERDNFEGISVRFQSNNKFQDERLTASVVDAVTEEILAEKTIELKYERIQNKDYGSTMYFYLPIKESEGRKVQIFFYMEKGENHTFPSLVLSTNQVEKSQLMIDGKMQDKALVFTANYMSGLKKSVLSELLNALIWILSGTVIFGFVSCSTKNDMSEVEVVKGKENNVIQLLKKYRKLLGILSLWGIMLVLCLYVYQYSVEKKIDTVKRREVFIPQKAEVHLDVDDTIDYIEQRFVCDTDNLSGIILPVSEKQNNVNSEIDVLVKNIKTEEILFEGKCESNDSNEYNISFINTFQNSKGCYLSLEIKPIRMDLKQIGFISGKEKQTESLEEVLEESFVKTGLLINGKYTENNIAVITEHNDVQFLNTLFLVFSSFLIFSVSVMYFVCFSRKRSIAYKYAVAALFFGLLLAFEIAVYTVPDEPSHIDTAYSISNKILGIPESSKPGYIFKRADDADMYVEQKQKLNVYSYERLFNELFEPLENDQLIECAALNNLQNSGMIFYIPQAIGLTLGRIFHCGTMLTLMLGRFMSLAVYIILSFFAIRKIPFAKISLVIIALLPISLQQAASFSYDSVINAMAFLFVSYCLAWAYRNDLKMHDLLIMIISGSLLSVVKGGVYLPICFLPILIILTKKNLSRAQKILISSVIGIFILSFVNKNLLNTLTRLLTEQGSAVGGSKNAEIYTFGYLLKYPHRFIGMFVNTFYEQGDSYLRNLLGGNLAWRDINVNWTIVFGFGFLLLVSCIRNNDEVEIGIKERIYLLGICAASFGLIELSMLLAWTPITHDYITGVQGRYFLPFFVLVLISMRNSLIILKKNIDQILLFAVVMLNVLTAFQVIQIVLE